MDPLVVKSAMQLSKGRILYIEDHVDTRELVSLVLSQNEYEVTVRGTIADGLPLAQSGKFDLILLDSWLPDGSGLEFCKQIRQRDNLTPILFYSAAAYETDRHEAIAAGAQGYLVKPSQNAELSELISILIDEFRKRFEAAQP